MGGTSYFPVLGTYITDADIVQVSGSADACLRELRIQAPVARFVGIGQGRATDRRAQTHVVELARLGGEARLDVAQTLAEGQLREGHASELLRTGEALDPIIASIPSNDAVQGLSRCMFHDLGEQYVADVHGHLQAGESWIGTVVGNHRSSRGHLEHLWSPRRCWLSGN